MFHNEALFVLSVTRQIVMLEQTRIITLLSTKMPYGCTKTP
jgi:hypothetical protein